MLGQVRSISLVLLSTMAGMSLWFIVAAVLPDMAAEAGLEGADLAWLSSVVPAGFAAGAMLFALTGVPDRIDPRVVLASCAVGTALVSLCLLVVPIGGSEAILLRFASGFLMAGIWPVALKIAVGWGVQNRGLLMGTLLAALVAGQALPFLLAWMGGTDWRLALILGCLIAGVGGAAVLASPLGPQHARAKAFQVRAIALAWTNPHIRSALLGYLGHMWEYIAFWSWVAVFSAVSYRSSMASADAIGLGKFTAFACILAAVPVCVWSGAIADKVGKARVAAAALLVSGSAGILTAVTFGGPVWLTLLLVIIWGASVIPDSTQYSAIVADHAPGELAGSLLTFQASLGFLLTVFAVQLAPIVAEAWGWPVLIGLLALGPAFGLLNLRPILHTD